MGYVCIRGKRRVSLPLSPRSLVRSEAQLDFSPGGNGENREQQQQPLVGSSDELFIRIIKRRRRSGSRSDGKSIQRSLSISRDARYTLTHTA